MIEQIILSWYVLWMISLLGMFVHFLVKNIKGETVTEVRNYFRDHFRSTAIAFIWTTVSFFGYYFALASGQMADVVAVFFIGYSFDSLLNKYEASQDIIGSK